MTAVFRNYDQKALDDARELAVALAAREQLVTRRAGEHRLEQDFSPPRDAVKGYTLASGMYDLRASRPTLPAAPAARGVPWPT